MMPDFQTSVTGESPVRFGDWLAGPRRIQLSRKAGWKMPPNTVVVSRPSKWGNQWKISANHDAAKCVEMFEIYCAAAGQFRESIKQLRGKNLACWCPLNQPCHADVLLRLANVEPSDSLTTTVERTRTLGISSNDCADSGKAIRSMEWSGARPPSAINGKTNPEYLKWYRRTKPEKYRKQHDRDVQLKKASDHESNKRAAKDECRCVECGMIFKRDDAILRGVRFLKYAGNRVVCDECA